MESLENHCQVTKVLSNDRVTFFQINGNPKKTFGFSNQHVAIVGGVLYTIIFLESKRLVEHERSFKAINEEFVLQTFPDLKDYTKHYVTEG